MPDRAINFGASEAETDYQMRQDGDDWLLEHLPSGATFEYDDTESAWIPTAPIGTSARPVPAVTTEDAVIGDRQLPALDSNGDVAESGNSVTINLSQSYDFVFLRVKKLNTDNSGTSTNEITLQINDITSNYTTHRVSGSNTSSAWVIGEATEFGNGRILGEVPIYTGQNTISLEEGLQSQATTDPVIAGTNDGFDQQIESLTFSSPNGVDIDAKVFGANYQS